MNILTMEDINYLTQQSTERINIILSGMTTLMSDTDNKVEGMEYQGWFQRMAKTVLGKNKITQAEIQQNYDKLNAYMSEAIGELFNRNCIDHEIMISLGTQLNELYADHVNLKQLLGAFVSKLNEKIDSVDNFHMLNTEINQGKYSSHTPIIAICKIISQFDKRILEEPRKLDILKRSMIEQNIINNEEFLLSDYLMNIADISAEEVGAIYLELGTIRSNFISNILLNMMERYHFLPDMERRLKSKNNLIEDVIKNKKLDKTIKLSINDIYNDFLNSKIDTQNNIIAIENVQNDNIRNTKDITIKEYKNSKNLINNAREAYKYIYECIEYVNMKIKDLPKESHPELQRMDKLINMLHSNNDIVEDMTIEQYNIHMDNFMELNNLFYKYITLNEQKNLV